MKAASRRHESDWANASEIEAAVREIWCRELNCAASTQTQEFFASGGDSLRAMRILAALEHRFGVEVPVDVFARAVTITSLAGQVEVSLAQAEARPELARECGEI